MSRTLDRLATFDEHGSIRVVVETPRGASLKMRLDPSIGAFTVVRALPAGMAYPFDWGFIPGTLGEDGDPLDALVLHEGSTYPGVVLACKLLGMICVTQRRKPGESERIGNNRLIVLPVWNDRLGQLAEACDLPERVKREIEQFFVNATYFTGKDVKVEGWKDAASSRRFIETAVVERSRR